MDPVTPDDGGEAVYLHNGFSTTQVRLITSSCQPHSHTTSFCQADTPTPQTLNPAKHPFSTTQVRFFVFFVDLQPLEK